MSHGEPPTRAAMRAGIADELRAIAEEGRLRARGVIDGPDARVISVRTDGRRQRLVNWASNDYLGAARALLVRNGAFRALRRYGAGSGAARLLAGGLRCHRVLEERLARWLGRAECLVTTTGYQANCALLAALASSNEDAIVLDRLCHASLYDGARLAGVPLLRFRHNDLDDLATQLQRSAGARRRIVCVESVYSMDGDEAPLAGVARLCDEHGALLVVDEAHALGLLGPGGRGLCAEAGVVPDALVGTCSKSLGSQGGFVAGDSDLIELVVNRGRSFIFSTAPVPAATGAAAAAVELIARRPDLATTALAAAQRLREGLRAQGWQVPDGRSAIVPVVVGEETAALDLASRLRAAGHFAPAIRPPTVPPGSCRLRLSVTAAHREVDVRRLLAAMGTLRG